MVVGAELLAFEKVDCGLVELQDHDFVEKVEALDVSVCSLDCLRQHSYFVHFALFRAEERLESVFSILHLADLFHVRVSLLDFRIFLCLHFAAPDHSLQDCLEVRNFKLKPAAHNGKRILKLFCQLNPILQLFIPRKRRLELVIDHESAGIKSGTCLARCTFLRTEIDLGRRWP